MTDLSARTATTLATVLAIALTWVVFFRLNAFVFAGLIHSERAHWIFLPAALRLLSVLMFEEAGVIGLMIGAYMTLPHAQPSDLSHELEIAASSGLGPLIGIWICRQMFPIAADLAGLKGRHIVALSVACAAANSIALNAILFLTDGWHYDPEQVTVVFVGDMLGIAIVLGLIAGSIGLLTRSARPSAGRP